MDERRVVPQIAPSHHSFEDEFPKSSIARPPSDGRIVVSVLGELWFRLESSFESGLLAIDLGSVGLELLRASHPLRSRTSRVYSFENSYSPSPQITFLI